METKIQEKILAKCSLRYIKGEADKIHECYLTSTKVYISRKGNVEVISLKDISSVKSTQMFNWILILIGLLISVFTLCNYNYNWYPEHPVMLTQTFQGDELPAFESLKPDLNSITAQKNWQDDKDALTFWIGAIGFIFLYYGFKKRAFLEINTNIEIIKLRVFTITDDYNNFYHSLLSKVGIVTTSKKS